MSTTSWTQQRRVYVKGETTVHISADRKIEVLRSAFAPHSRGSSGWSWRYIARPMGIGNVRTRHGYATKAAAMKAAESYAATRS